jgi:Mg-chelatase subunit ChlD/pSer/pThr/pTyr-binding forkhead associated (FHA) protein
MTHDQRFRIVSKLLTRAKLALLGLTFAAVWVPVSWTQATQPATQLTAGPSYTSGDEKANAPASTPKFPTVDVVFELSAADGTPVAAKAGDLKLFSQGNQIGTATSLRSFEQSGQGITAILAIDASGSMKGAPLAAIHASIAKFVNQARSQDQVEVITFADQTRVDVPFGASQAALTRELQTVQARGKYTHLWDGLLDALAQFTATQPKRRQIVVISDGHDEGSTHAMADVVLKAKSLSVVIDSIGLTKDAGQYLSTLQQLSQQTGGSYHRAQNAQALEGLIGQGIQANRATPVATFKTSHLTGDDKLHAVQLRWTPGNLAAATFVKTPKLNLIDTVKAQVKDNIWIWALGGCFVAGVILLILSLIGSRRKSKPTAPYPATAYAPAPQANIETTSYPAPQVSSPPPVSSATEWIKPVRASTLPEGSYPTTPAPAPVESPAKFTADRTRTQLAIFFEAASNGALASLEITTGALAGQSVSMSTPTFTMGAVDGNSLILPGDSTISAHHARLLWESSILKIEDTNSTNGTFVNGSRLSAGRQLLKPGDEIRMGQTLLTVLRA